MMNQSEVKKNQPKIFFFVIMIILIIVFQLVNYSIKRSRDGNFFGLEKILYPENFVMKLMVGIFGVLLITKIIILVIIFAVIYVLDKEKRIIFLVLCLIMINASIPGFSLGMVGIENIIDVITNIGSLILGT